MPVLLAFTASGPRAGRKASVGAPRKNNKPSLRRCHHVGQGIEIVRWPSAAEPLCDAALSTGVFSVCGLASMFGIEQQPARDFDAASEQLFP